MGINLPVKNEIPKRVVLDHLPAEVMRSEALEALIQQNDDLMARLSVSLRRISGLEDTLNSSKQSNEKIKFQYESLKDQVMILQQKMRAIVERREGHQDHLKSLQDQIKKLQEELRVSEIRFSESHLHQSDRQNQLLSRIDQHALRLKRHLIYRERVQKSAKNMRLQYQNKIQKILNEKLTVEHNLNSELSEIKGVTQDQIKALQEEKDFRIAEIKKNLNASRHAIEKDLSEKIQTLTHDNDAFRKKIDFNDLLLKDLKDKLNESTTYIQTQGKQYKDEQQNIISSYETRIRKIYADHDIEINKLQENFAKVNSQNGEKIETLQREKQLLFDKCSELERVYEENVALQNKIVFTERKRDEISNKLHDELEVLQKSLSHYRADAKSKNSELENVRTDLKNQNENSVIIKNQLKEVEEKYESLQDLWKQTHQQLEKEAEKNKSLQKLNHQMSQTYNQLRQENRDLAEKVEAMNHQYTTRMREMSKNQEVTDSILSIKKGSEPSNKVDSLIAEIQSGFTIRD